MNAPRALRVLLVFLWWAFPSPPPLIGASWPAGATETSHRLVLPGGGSRLVATRTRVSTDLPEFQGQLALRSRGKTLWTTLHDGYHVEALDLVDLNRDGRFEVVAWWRGQGRGRRLRFDVWGVSDTVPVSIFSLPEPAYEGEGRLKGDPWSGHLSIVLADSLPGRLYVRPFLRRTRRFYLSSGGLRTLAETYGAATTLRQRFALARALLARRLDARACAALERLYRDCRRKGRWQREAALLLAACLRRLKRPGPSRRLVERWKLSPDVVERVAKGEVEAN